MSFTLDPEIAEALAPMTAAMEGSTPPAVGDVAARRAVWEPIIGAAGAAQPMPPDVTTAEYNVTSYDGARVTTRWYVKHGAAPGPAVLFFHGGGYIFGHLGLFDGPVARYVSASGVPILSVEYRRAPEHPYPTPLEDAYNALHWLHEHAAELGVDRDRIGVMGDSAGGGMAAALTILTRDRGGPRIARQILLMPMLDDRTTTPDPHARGSGKYLREITAPGVDTKFVERHRDLLAALLGVDCGATAFIAGLGLRAKPVTVRLRCDPAVLGLPAPLSEGTFRLDEVAALSPAVRVGVIIENETTYLTVPVPDGGVVIWGKGFEVDRVGALPWLRDAPIHYWGDLDTHGFAILDKLRAWLPHARSFLMDRETLLAHRERWVPEGSPTAARLDRLDPTEADLYDDLVADRLGVAVRLEQERLDWTWARARLPYS